MVILFAVGWMNYPMFRPPISINHGYYPQMHNAGIIAPLEMITHDPLLTMVMPLPWHVKKYQMLSTALAMTILPIKFIKNWAAANAHDVSKHPKKHHLIKNNYH